MDASAGRGWRTLQAAEEDRGGEPRLPVEGFLRCGSLTRVIPGSPPRVARALQRHLPPKSSQYGTLWPTRLDKIKNLHSTDTIDTENSGTRGRPIWVHSSQGGKADSKWVCRVVPAYPNVSPGPMNGSILLRRAYFDDRQNHLRDADGTVRRTVTFGPADIILRKSGAGTGLRHRTLTLSGAAPSPCALPARKLSGSQTVTLPQHFGASKCWTGVVGCGYQESALLEEPRSGDANPASRSWRRLRADSQVRYDDARHIRQDTAGSGDLRVSGPTGRPGRQDDQL